MEKQKKGWKGKEKRVIKKTESRKELTTPRFSNVVTHTGKALGRKIAPSSQRERTPLHLSADGQGRLPPCHAHALRSCGRTYSIDGIEITWPAIACCCRGFGAGLTYHLYVAAEHVINISDPLVNDTQELRCAVKLQTRPVAYDFDITNEFPNPQRYVFNKPDIETAESEMTE